MTDRTHHRDVGRVDVLVIGAGPGGYACAARAAELGLTVAIAEAGPLGGVCLNRGCIPTKGLLSGVDGEGIAHRIARNAEAIAALRRGLERLLKRVTVLDGQARITGPGRVMVDGHGEVAAAHIVIAGGSSPKPLVLLPFDGERVISSDHALQAETVPKRLVVIGAGAVGLEFADIFAAYGARVTLIEAAPRILPEADPWLAKHLGRAFKSRGIEVLTGASINRASVGEDSVLLTVSGAGGGDTQSIEADRVLVAVGRVPNLGRLGLDAVGLVPSPHGISVDGHGRTAVAGLFAVGDVTGPPQLAHRASRQGEIAAGAIAAIMAGKPPKPVVDALIPACVYTHPQLAWVGAGPDEVQGLRVGEAIFRANGLALVTGEGGGGVRLVADADGVLKGAQLAGNGVTEMVGLLSALIQSGAGVSALVDAVFPHPTLSETIREAALSLQSRLKQS